MSLIIPSPLLDDPRLQTMPVDGQSWAAMMRELALYVPEYKYTEVTTTDNTVTIIATLPLVENSANAIYCIVVGKEPGTGNMAVFGRVGGWYRNGSGVATRSGATTDWFTAINDPAWTGVSMTRNSTTTSHVNVNVRGALATTVNWRARVWSMEVRD